MKTFSDEALAALQRGDAIVSASVEIIPVGALGSGGGVGSTGAVLTWWQTTQEQTDEGATENDSARMGLAFYDVDGIQIGSTVWAPYLAPLPDWIERTLSTTIPDGTTTIRIFQDRVRHWGVANDGYIDDISLTVDGSPVTIINPGAELSHTGWITALGGLQFRTGSPAPHSGTKYFYGDGAENIVYQDVAVTIEPPVDPIEGDGIIRLWGGYGDKELPSDDGVSVFHGIGDRGLVQQTTASIGGSAQNLTLSLSGIEPAALEVLDPSEVKGAAAVVRRLIFDSAGTTLLGAYVYTRGRVDELKTSEVVGGSATIELSIEGAARGLGRRGGRIRSDADQRLVSPTDGFYRVVSAAPKKTLYWGGKKPSTIG
jgi:hypothetical protein